MDFPTSHHLEPPLLVGEVLLVAESGYLSCWSTPGCSGVWVGTELPHMFNHFQLSKCAEFHADLTPGPQKTIAQKWSRTSVLTDVLHFTWVIGTLFGCHLQTSHSVIQTLHHSTHGGLQVGFLSSKKNKPPQNTGFSRNTDIYKMKNSWVDLSMCAFLSPPI